MSKYSEDSYLIFLFDEYGTKIESRISPEPGLIRSQAAGFQIIKDEPRFASFAVLRVLFNTIDDAKRKRWA